MSQDLSKWFDRAVLGTTVPTGKNFPGDSRRPSYEQVENLKVRLRNGDFLSDPGDREEFILSGIEQLASGALSGAELGRFEAIVSALANGYYEKIGAGKYKYIYIADEATEKKARIAQRMAMAVGYLEGNIAPNDLGYFAEKTLSLVRLDEIVVDDLKAAHDYLTENPELFGARSKEFYNAVAARVGRQRPTFGGSSVRPDVLIPVFGIGQSAVPKTPTIEPM